MSAGATSYDPSMLVVRFPDQAAANSRIAGVSAVARWVARARAAGFAEIAVLMPGNAGWPAATRDDFARIGGAPHVVHDTQPGAVDGRFLPGEDALRALAIGRLAVLNLAACIDLAHPADATRQIVRATAKRSDGVISRWLNRPVSQRISVLLLRHVPGVRPSHMTAVGALVAILMMACLLLGGAGGLIAGGVLFHVASVLDGVDGEIARASYRSSQAGAELDTRVDMLTNIGYFIGVAIALTRLYGGRQAVVGGLAVLFALTGLALLAWLVRRGGKAGSFDVLKPYYRERFPGGWQWLLTETLVVTTSRDFFAFAFGVVIVSGAGWAVSWLLMAFTATWLVAVLCAVPGVLRRAELQPLRTS